MSKESTPSEKAADRMHADLDAMVADACRHRETAKDEGQRRYWHDVSGHLAQTRYLVTKLMSERDRRIAQNG